MSIIRSPRKDRNFTIISNSVCLDQRLSMRALGALVRLLSRPDNWKTNSDTLAREFGCGREQMRSVLNELTEAQYMSLNKIQDDKGHWSSTWIVYDEPTSVQVTEPEPELPKPGQPRPGNPYVGLSGPITRTDLTRTDNKDRSTSNPDLGFEQFWTAYPRKTNKGFARTVFGKIKPNEEMLKKMISSIDRQKRSDQWKDPKYIPHPSSWLNGERWEDEEPTGKPSFNPLAGAI